MCTRSDHVRRACARAARVFLAAARITFPKYASASAGAFPQRPPEPRPHLLQVRHVGADRPVRQARRRPRQHEPGQHVRLERRHRLRPPPGHAPPACPAPPPAPSRPRPDLHSRHQNISRNDRPSPRVKKRQHADSRPGRSRNAVPRPHLACRSRQGHQGTRNLLNSRNALRL